ncbi:hypothetical protein KOR34_50730 [Posidoniimonas corsicana]|uniref:Uncharacterized protein n=1 Tax=Posidoniimonas corsicana TaxID=1938618 RepID=A0A5C5UWL1_9BACT|nr:hypothetical protein [Posidoniimonas corsicana]TWT29755.1 hypothetical protein KOR34_50730 [Posidoniimonas corsicana]
MLRTKSLPVLLAAALAAACSAPASAQIDNLELLVDELTATNENAIAAFGYNPTDDTMFISSFGAGGALRKVSNVSTAPTSEIYVTETELQLYYRDGDPDRSVLSPLQSAIQLNPLPIIDGENTIPAYSMAIINDNGRTREPGSNTTDPAATKRFYQYNLEPVDFMNGEDGRDVFTTLATLADMQAAVGEISTSSNQGRQGAWSGDGQFLYFADSSTSFGGVWKLNPISGAIEQLLAGARDTNIEPAVLTSEGVDTVFISGADEVNDGGIDSFTYDGVTVGPRTTHVSAAALQDFLELSGDDVADVRSMTADGDGNLYFNSTDSSPNRRGIFRLDPEGRLAKVVGYAERDLFFTGQLDSSPNPNSNTLRMQTRTVTHPTAGEVTQVMYAESSPVNSVAGAYAFEPGDFDRDGDLDSDDLGMLATALTTRGVEIIDDGDYRFDMNANAVVDWKDVKILQQFAEFPTGDANLDGALDFTDLDILNANYHLAAADADKTWLTGDIASFVAGYPAAAFDANAVNLADLVEFAGEWVDTLAQAISEEDLTTRYTGGFLDDALVAFGFAPSSLLGDYNGDSIVDAADYTVWRDSLGAEGDSLAADGYADGVIDGLDYQLWRNQFGATAVVSAGAAAPEPASLALAGAVAVAAAASRRPCREDLC